MSENKKPTLPDGAKLLPDGKHFQLKNEQYGKVEKNDKKEKSD